MYYVIQVKTGKEDQTMKDILKFASSDPYFEVFSPYRKTLRKYNGVYKEVKERCFPGYLFVETDDIKRLFYDLYEVPGFTKILGREGTSMHFESLSEEESRMVDILYNANAERTTEISDITIEEGDKIRILSGPLKDLDAKVKKVDLHKRKITVIVPFFKRDVEVKVGINIVMKTEGK